MTAATLILGFALTLVSAAPEQQLEQAIEDFEFGEHAKAEQKLSAILNPIRLESAENVIVARQYLGACYFLLDERTKAEAEFAKILALDPDHKLDPEVFSPALVKFFEDVRQRTGLSFRKRPDPNPPPKEDKVEHTKPPPPVPMVSDERPPSLWPSCLLALGSSTTTPPASVRSSCRSRWP